MKRPEPQRGRNASRAYRLQARVAVLERVYGRDHGATRAAIARLDAARGRAPSLWLWSTWGDLAMAAWAREAGHAGHLNRGMRRARARAFAAALVAFTDDARDDRVDAFAYGVSHAW